jgi:hypothetical protein
LVTHADTKALEEIEDQIGRVIAEVVMRMGLNWLPFRPSQRTMHPMVKAVVADPDPLEACEQSTGIENSVRGGFADGFGTVESGAWM